MLSGRRCGLCDAAQRARCGSATPSAAEGKRLTLQSHPHPRRGARQSVLTTLRVPQPPCESPVVEGVRRVHCRQWQVWRWEKCPGETPWASLWCLGVRWVVCIGFMCDVVRSARGPKQVGGGGVTDAGGGQPLAPARGPCPRGGAWWVARGGSSTADPAAPCQ